MNILAWETEKQRHQDMQRKAQKAALGETVLAANRQRQKARFLHLYRNVVTWLRKPFQTRYNRPIETVRHVPPVAHADPPMR